MRKVVHISDLHFGRVNYAAAEGLIKDLNKIQPDVVVISGDLTQRGRSSQYAEAKEYLKKIDFPKLVVPGNHDVPLFDVLRRMILPLERYKKYIAEDLSPLYIDSELIIFGINTARSFTWKDGRISIEQIREMEKILCPLGTEKMKIVVTHHPFLPPPGDEGISLVGRSVKALKVIDKCNVDILLAGHFHQGYSGDVRTIYPDRGRSVISIQAGTAISSRTRKAANSFNLLTLSGDYIKIDIRIWNGNDFEAALKTDFRREDVFWIKENKSS